MLFKRLGDLTSKHAWLILFTWIGMLVVLFSTAPKWEDVVQNGEFAFLPEDSPSRKATEEFREAFPNDMLASTLVLLVRRESEGGILDSDYEFLRKKVIPEIHRIAKIPTPEQQLSADAGIETAVAELPKVSPDNIVQQITWFDDNKIGDLLISEDKQAATIVMGLRTEFLNQSNIALVDEVERFVKTLSRTPSGETTSLPAGLEIAISGSATFGRDMIRESQNSAKSTEKWTVILVVGLLIVIYRAPALAMIPLITVAVSTAVSRTCLALAAKAGLISLFNGIETYVTVLIYGAGVDYCLFLIARYREELDGGQTIEDSISGTLERIGAALTASAGTVMCGIGMLMFAEFGKFRQAGFAITFGLGVCLIAALTLTPAILRILGRFAFWPNLPTQRRESGFLSSSDIVSRLQKKNLFTAGWHWIGGVLERHTWAAWLCSIGLMLPFTIVGIVFFGDLSYGLLSELPDTAASVYGADAVQRHFPAGEVAPLTVLVDAGSPEFRFRMEPTAEGEAAKWKMVSLDEGGDVYPLDDVTFENGDLKFSLARKQATYTGKLAADGKSAEGIWHQDDRDYDLAFREENGAWSGSLKSPAIDFSPIQGEALKLIQTFTSNLVEKRQELGLQSVRSLSSPKGQREQGKMTNAIRAAQKSHARKYFVSSINPAVTRVDLIFQNDPFARSSISEFRYLRDHIREQLPEGLKNSTLSFVGNTADISDLKTVTDSDQVRIDTLVMFGVYLILVVLLRKPGVCGYLMFTVFYSYLATLGITYLAFWAMDPAGFSGLDWKVPMFLFTILIAVGEDYNIFLMARIEEEQVVYGPVKGITVALERTGSIISSCGIIMAGTFSSLMAGSLVGMDQLGFALALGVLLDTFVIRPIMVPSFLMLLATGRLGAFSRMAGYEKKSEDVTSRAA